MNNISNVIVMEGDTNIDVGTNIAVMFCAACGNSFRANVDLVTCANKRPVCRPCIEWANPKRIANGLKPFPLVKSAYLQD